MARFAALLLGLALVAAGAASAAAQCVADESGDGLDGIGCTRCSADKSRCESCADRWVLTTDGKCAQCNATHINGWQQSCVSCRADDPTICLRCENYCNTGGCTGYYVTREGHCSHCPEGAAACDDLTGEVRECRSGLGLVGGECRPCKVAGCQKCDGDLWTCTKCVISRAASQDGYFPDPATGACAPCDKGCKACSGPGACMQCTHTVLDPIQKTCQPCTVSNCLQCSQALDKCDGCDKGFQLDASSNSCVPCGVANCLDCSTGDRCLECSPGYGLENPQQDEDSGDKVAAACHKCTKPDPNCLACDGNPAVCSKCADGMAPDPGTGLCTPCRLENARLNTTCSSTDATRCDDDEDCAGGFYCHNATFLCTACPGEGCGACESSEPDVCAACLPGWWDANRPINEQRFRTNPSTNSTERWESFSELPPECKPCADKNCLVCATSRGAACERCADGYFLDSASKLCRACTEPDGAKYDSCVPAPAAAPAPAAEEQPS